ncbi:unnamed protein product [Ectocarpus sp. 12 AP-2014]
MYTGRHGNQRRRYQVTGHHFYKRTSRTRRYLFSISQPCRKDSLQVAWSLTIRPRRDHHRHRCHHLRCPPLRHLQHQHPLSVGASAVRTAFPCTARTAPARAASATSAGARSPISLRRTRGLPVVGSSADAPCLRSRTGPSRKPSHAPRAASAGSSGRFPLPPAPPRRQTRAAVACSYENSL